MPNSTLSKALVPREGLRRAREATGLSQQELADAAGTTVATISDLENGRNREPSHSKVVSIVRALRANGLPGASIEELFPVALVHYERQERTRARRKSRWTPRHPRT